MIIEGIKLMLIGMATVMLFLTLMIFLIGLVSRLTSGAAARELEAIKLERDLLARNRRDKQARQDAAARADTDEEGEIAAIAAAVAAYEAEKFAGLATGR